MTEQTVRAEIIGFDSGWGCKDFGCEDGPAKLSADQIICQLRENGVQTIWRGALGLKFLADHKEHTTKEATLPMIREALHRLFNSVRQAIENKSIPVVIGGDHSSAIGTWAGAVAATGAYGTFGLIWLDAHLDAHTYETSKEGKWGGWWHGQPVSALTGHGLPELTGIGGPRQKISPQHLSIIGVHSFEPAEVEYVKKNGIRVYYLDEVKARGFKQVFAEALARATEGTEAFGLTVDLDSFREADAPGVGTAEGDGLVAAEVLPIIQALAYNPAFKALEIAEFNPHKDKDGKTCRLIGAVINSVFMKPKTDSSLNH
jgi:arginase